MSQPAIESDPTITDPASQEPAAKKPWGDDKDFDPEKAWKLIQDLRTQKNDPAAARELTELRAKAAKFDEAERAKMSELDQHKSTAATEKARADKAELDLARLTVGMEHGLTVAQAARLSGSTKEEIEADGPKLAAELGITKADPAADPAVDPETPPEKDITGNTRRPTQQPVVTPRGGTDPSSEPDPDLDKIVAEIPR